MPRGSHACPPSRHWGMQEIGSLSATRSCFLGCQLWPPPAPTVGYHPLAHPSKRGQGEVRMNFSPPCLPLSSVGGWDEGYDAPLP